jgi:ribonuclease III
MVEQVRRHVVDTDPKGRLQKIILQRVGILPLYRVLERSGRQNDCVFEVGVFVHDKLLGVGKASSIKEAGRIAAREALKMEEKWWLKRN